MNRIDHLCGPISSSIPGKRGSNGPRSRVTFVATYTHGVDPEDFVLTQLQYENESITTAIELSYNVATDKNGNPLQVTYPQLKNDTPSDNEGSNVGDILKWNDVWKKATPTESSDLVTNRDIYRDYNFYENETDEIDSSRGYLARIKNSFIQISCDGIEAKNPKISNYLNVDPEPYDYIIFVDRNSTFILIIESVNYGDYHDTTICNCKVIDVWKKPSDDAQQITDATEITDNINIYCIKYNLMYKKLSDRQYVTNLDTTPTTEQATETDTLRNFLIVSNDTKKTIGNYKIELDFISDYNTSLTYSTIKSKFTGKDDFFFGNVEKYDRNVSRNYDDMKFSGSSYDDERLDTFTIVIKDYNDGLGELTYNPTVTLPIKLLKALHTHYTNVHLYIYYKKLNGSINKVLVSEMSVDDFINWDDTKNILK